MNIPLEKDTRQALEDCQAEISSLAAKLEELGAELPRLAEEVRQMEAAKRVALDDFCRDKCSRSELEKAQDAHDRAARSESQAKELLETVTRRQQKLVDELPVLQRKHRQAIGDIWRDLADGINDEVRREAGGAVTKAYAANLRSSRGLPYGAFLEKLFPLPGDADLSEFGPELDRIFTETVGNGR